MDFEIVLKFILEGFERRNVRYGAGLDWRRLEEYFSLFDRAEEFSGLRIKYGRLSIAPVTALA